MCGCVGVWGCGGVGVWGCGGVGVWVCGCVGVCVCVCVLGIKSCRKIIILIPQGSWLTETEFMVSWNLNTMRFLEVIGHPNHHLRI